MDARGKSGKVQTVQGGHVTCVTKRQYHCRLAVANLRAKRIDYPPWPSVRAARTIVDSR